MVIQKSRPISGVTNSINFALNNDVDFNKENIDLLKLYDFDQWSKEIKMIFDE